MNEKNKTKISKFLSLILRHKPDAIGLILDDNGWADVAELVKKCAENGHSFTKNDLVEVVETNDKKRFAFDKSGTKIRASQGHSIEVEIKFEENVAASCSSFRRY